VRARVFGGADATTGYRAQMDVVGPSWDTDTITFQVRDPDQPLAGGRLVRDAGQSPARSEFAYDGRI
jgi:hypothetical protein